MNGLNRWNQKNPKVIKLEFPKQEESIESNRQYNFDLRAETLADYFHMRTYN